MLCYLSAKIQLKENKIQMFYSVVKSPKKITDMLRGNFQIETQDLLKNSEHWGLESKNEN